MSINPIILILLILIEFINLIWNIFSYIPIILYYIYVLMKKLRIFFEYPFDDYFLIKLILASIAIFKIHQYVIIKTLQWLKLSKYSNLSNKNLIENNVLK